MYTHTSISIKRKTQNTITKWTMKGVAKDLKKFIWKSLAFFITDSILACHSFNNLTWVWDKTFLFPATVNSWSYKQTEGDCYREKLCSREKRQWQSRDECEKGAPTIQAFITWWLQLYGKKAILFTSLLRKYFSAKPSWTIHELFGTRISPGKKERIQYKLHDCSGVRASIVIVWRYVMYPWWKTEAKSTHCWMQSIFNWSTNNR